MRLVRSTGERDSRMADTPQPSLPKVLEGWGGANPTPGIVFVLDRSKAARVLTAFELKS